MAVNRFKIALNNARFPLVSTKAQRAVFIPGYDSAPRTPKTFMGETESIDYNTAQIIFGENIMPSAEGVKSVGYSQLVAPTVNTDFDSIFALRDADENTVLFSPAAGKNYIYDSSVNMWADNPLVDVLAEPLVTGVIADSKITYAYVDGKTFVCYSRLAGATLDLSIYFWNSATQLLEPAGALIANIPYDIGTIDGIAASNGFLLIYSGLSVAWAPFNGTAFDYEIYANGNYTGAGNQIAEDIKGNIRAVLALPGGFIMATDKNAVAASYYAQSLVAPWVFREVPSAGGLESYEQATVEGTLGKVFALTTAGLQALSLNSAESVWPDVSDFLTGRQVERYRYDLQEIYQGLVNLDFFVKIANVGNRFIVISYGTFPGIYSYALVFDLGLERWGKLRIVHRDAFYYAYGVQSADLTYAALGDVPYDSPDLGTYEGTTNASNAFVSAPHGLAFLKATGEVVVANWSDQARETRDEAVAVIGRIQLSRSRNTQLNRVEVEGLVDGDVYVQPSYNGRDLAAAELLTVIESGTNYKIVGGMVDCKNFNLAVQGTFQLSTMITEAALSGRI